MMERDRTWAIAGFATLAFILAIILFWRNGGHIPSALFGLAMGKLAMIADDTIRGRWHK